MKRTITIKSEVQVTVESPVGAGGAYNTPVRSG